MKLLLPTHYRAKGLLAVSIGLTGMLIATNNGLVNFYRILQPERAMNDGSYPYPANFWDINATFLSGAVCLVVVGIIALFLAKEPDEFFYKVRLESIQFAIYVQFIVMLALFAFFYFTPGYQLINTWVSILGLGLSSFFVTYVLRYYYAVFFQSDRN
ncbi:hypothetical protein [Dyadobacter alkalitolerans]|uniref:hypothetical protein n=1 Tax=Dyadobacter alkalitolerans TaxID=492736 RepID=UPI000478C980|nr:hypothetical protein [Dyadobacter alkalitolerans]